MRNPRRNTHKLREGGVVASGLLHFSPRLGHRKQTGPYFGIGPRMIFAGTFNRTWNAVVGQSLVLPTPVTT
jgi:hypothetical protein